MFTTELLEAVMVAMDNNKTSYDFKIKQLFNKKIFTYTLSIIINNTEIVVYNIKCLHIPDELDNKHIIEKLIKELYNHKAKMVLRNSTFTWCNIL